MRLCASHHRALRSITLLGLLWSTALAGGSCRKRSAVNPLLLGFDPRRVPAPVFLYGHVQDQDGNPVADVEIDVRTVELSPENVTLDGVVAGKGAQTIWTTYTGKNGDFVVGLSNGQNWVEVRAVRKPGYDWVIDHAWTLSHTASAGDNRTFTFLGRFAPFPIYSPDPNAPAIYPLHLKGSEKLPGDPSRGGSDINADGVRTRNAPRPARVPSAGPGAPQTPKEIADSLAVLGGRHTTAKP